MNPLEAMNLGLISPDATPYSVLFDGTSVSTTKLTQYWVVKAVAGTSLLMQWGDGVEDWLAATGSDQVFSHTYLGAGTYYPKLYCQLVANLQKLDCSSNGLTGALPSFAAAVGLTYFSCRNNSFTGTLPSFNTCTSLVTFSCAQNTFSGTLPSFAACTSMTSMEAYINAFTGYISQVIPATMKLWDVATNSLPSASVNAMLADMATGIAGRPTGGVMNVGGTGNGAPTGQGLIDQATIEGKPWNVNTTLTAFHYTSLSGLQMCQGAFDVSRATTNTQPVILNPGFSSDTVWVKGLGWSIPTPVATHAPGSAGELQQNSTGVVAGNRYSYTWELTRYVAGVFCGQVGGTSGSGRTAAGTYTDEITSGGTTIRIQADAAGDGDVDNVSISNLSLNSYTPAYVHPQWTGSNLVQATDTAKPWKSSDGLGIRYQGGDLFTWATAAACKFLHDGTGGTLIVAVRPSVLNAVNAVFATCYTGTAANVGMSLHYTNANSIALTVNNGGGASDLTLSVASAVSTGNTYIMTVKTATGTNACIIRKNGLQLTAGSLTAPSLANAAVGHMTGAWSAGSTAGVDGTIGDEQVVTRALSDAECLAAERDMYLRVTGSPAPF